MTKGKNAYKQILVGSVVVAIIAAIVVPASAATNTSSQFTKKNTETFLINRFDVSTRQMYHNYKSLLISDIYSKLFGSGSFLHFNEFYKLQKQLLDDQQKYDNAKFPHEKMIDEILRDQRRVDNGKDFLNDVIKNNNRLDYYDLYIKLAKRLGYVVTDYEEYLTKYKDTDQKVLILRHDIDITDEATKYMFEIEKANHVKASYYFRWRTFDKRLIQDIAKEGFEVGLHYETIATYCIKNDKYRLNSEDMKECRALLKNEIASFKELTGVDIKTIASHGNPVNRKIRIPNFELLIGQKYSDYGIIGETYDSKIMHQNIKSYICDAELTKKSGFSYPENPIGSMLDNAQVIEFLSHPNHWNYDNFRRAKYYIELEHGDALN